MAAATEFLLERVVHQVLKGERGRSIIDRALDTGMTPESLIAEILWPAMECVQQLHRDGTVTARIHNTAVRALRSLLDLAAMQLAREPEQGRSLFIVSAPGERVELGAHMVATLAEGHGWKVYFAGAGLSMEEVTFSIGQLSPDVVVVQGSLAESGPQVGQFVKQLQKICIWPNVQIVVVGGVTEGAGLAGDLLGRHPVEALELMALWPEYRAGAGEKGTAMPLQMLTDPSAPAEVSAEIVQAMMARHFGRKREHLN